ncbi:MAG: hypothetical protein JWM28_2843 [Chitinophagaceae bacterium]|nr:hypothetical protein [Chitinophagaceae bacterium]
MYESFSITVPYENKEIELEGEFRQLGYSYQLVVFVDGTEIIFEPDEERHFRAVIRGYENINKPPSKGLVKAIAEKLEGLFK